MTKITLSYPDDRADEYLEVPAVPRVGDRIVRNKILWSVVSVTWDYEGTFVFPVVELNYAD